MATRAQQVGVKDDDQNTEYVRQLIAGGNSMNLDGKYNQLLLSDLDKGGSMIDCADDHGNNSDY